MKSLFQIDKENAEEAEAALTALETELIYTLDACAFGIILFDIYGNCVGLNNRWQELYHINYSGMKDYNMLNDPVIKTKHIWEAVRDSFEGVPGIVDENYFTPEEWNKPGRGCWTKGYALPLFKKSKKQEEQIGETLILEDVTRQKLLEEEVSKLKSRIEQIQTAQEKLLGQLSSLRESERSQDIPGLRTRPHLLKLHDESVSIPRREREVFEKLAEGWTVKEAAHQLNLGIKSVYTYRARLLKRLGLSSDVELALAWREIQDYPVKS